MAQGGPAPVPAGMPQQAAPVGTYPMMAGPAPPAPVPQPRNYTLAELNKMLATGVQLPLNLVPAGRSFRNFSGSISTSPSHVPLLFLLPTPFFLWEHTCARICVTAYDCKLAPVCARAPQPVWCVGSKRSLRFSRIVLLLSAAGYNIASTLIHAHKLN